MTPNRVEKLVFAVLGRVGPPRRLCTLRRCAPLQRCTLTNDTSSFGAAGDAGRRDVGAPGA